MPSLRKRVTSYIRQLSFHNEPREKRQNVNENSFVTKYLQGQIKLKNGPPVISGKTPTDLPNYDLATYCISADSIIGCYTGPNGGLTTVRRTEKHLSVTDPDIDFIDTQEENASQETKLKPDDKKVSSPIDNTTMTIKVAGQEYFVTDRKKQIKSQSVGSLSDLTTTSTSTESNRHEDPVPIKIFNGNDGDDVSKKGVSIRRKDASDKSKRDQSVCDSKDIEAKGASKDTRNESKSGKRNNNPPHNNSEHVRRRSGSNRSNSSVKTFQNQAKNHQSKAANSPNSSSGGKKPATGEAQTYNLSKSKSEGNPFQHRKRGKIIKIAQRPISSVSALSSTSEAGVCHVNDALLPEEWQKHSNHIYGLSDSLYDRNQISNVKNGDPIADCFGVIARKDSAILAVADGVNWGEKACIAAKSAIHGCLHYLNKTIFNDTGPFESLIKSDAKEEVKSETPLHESHVTNTREVFVCLLRAFNCAHDLILENNGMLTTLTVAVVLPLKRSGNSRNGDEKRPQESDYVCCVCNVGDTLGYVYSHKYGLRELTKGSHDIQTNRDMRDALGALGPVDGTNPELSNLTLSVTKMQKGDIVLLASDGLTDNFDPNVCKFTVNSNLTDSLKGKRETSGMKAKETHRSSKPLTLTPPKKEEAVKKAPVKPPRRNYVKGKENVLVLSKSEERKVSVDSVDNKSTIRTVNNLNFSTCNHANNNIGNSDSDDVANSNPSGSSKQADDVSLDNPLIAQFLRENSLDESGSLEKCKTSVTVDSDKPIRQFSSQLSAPASLTMQKDVRRSMAENKSDAQKYNFLRSKTSLDLRAKPIQRNEDGIPYVTPVQRYELTLLLMEDILKHGISGRDGECVTAKMLCENLMRFTFSITAAKRHTLEDNDLYYDHRNGLLVEVSSQEKKIRRKRGLEKVQNLPGKLDHVTVVAFNVGNYSCHHP